MTPPRYVRDRAQLRGTPNAPAQLPAPRTSPTHHTSPALHARTLCIASAPSCTATSPVRGMVRVLNPSCPNCLTVCCITSTEHRHVHNCLSTQQHWSQWSSSVRACFPCTPIDPDSPSSRSGTPSSRVRSHRRYPRINLAATEATAATHQTDRGPLVLCLPLGWGPGIDAIATPVHTGALAGQECRCMCFPTAIHMSWLHAS